MTQPTIGFGRVEPAARLASWMAVRIIAASCWDADWLLLFAGAGDDDDDDDDGGG